MTLGSRRQLLLFGALAFLLLLALVKMRGGRPAAATSGARASASSTGTGLEEERPIVGRARAGRSEKKVSPDEVPIITTRDLDPARSRTSMQEGRNIFDFRAPTLPPPPTPTPAPPPPPAPGDPRFVGPLPPPTPTPTPPPPEISFKFIGIFGSKEKPIAALSQGGTILNAREGDVVFGQFILRKIGYESIDVGFVGRDPKETRRLGLTP